uniref:Uncharacterized protein n=1 Tax=Caenorhabditis japonica TaxID=281687 RepID=A0A8R1EFB5_CAEJA
MNRARKTSSCGCFRSAFCLLKPSTSSASDENADSDKKLLSPQMSRDKEQPEPLALPRKIPPLDLNGVEVKIKVGKGGRRRISEGGAGQVVFKRLTIVIVSCMQ